MRSKMLAVVAGLLQASVVVGAESLTVTDAMRLAATANPVVRAREAQLAAAEGLRREAAAPFFNNPTVSVENSGRRGSGPDGRTIEWNVGVAQPFELGGQQGLRREAAAAGLDALRAEIDEARRLARAEAATRFYAVLAAQRRIGIEQRSAQLFESVAQTVAKRRAAGEDTRLDANVALIEAERARNALALARERLLDARAELAASLQWPPDTLPEVSDAADAGSDTVPRYTLEQLLASVQSLPRQRALAARETSARARLAVERASLTPDLTVGLSVGREGFRDSRESVVTLSLSMPLPLFKRNDAAIGQALTDVGQAQVERASSTREGPAQVRRLWNRVVSQRERVERLQRTMAPAYIDNQQLTIKSRQAGQIGLLEQLTVNRQTLEAERELNDALAELHATTIELEHAAGWPQQGISQ